MFRNTNLSHIGLLMILIVALSSCNRRTAVKSDAALDDMASFEAFLLKYNDRIIQPDWFFGKGQMQIKAEQMNATVNAVISMQRDERILMAVSKLGFEVGRAYASKDTVILIDRLRKQYLMATGDELKKKNIPFNLKSLQSLLLGRPEYTVINEHHFGEDSISFYSFMPPFQFFYTFDDSRLLTHSLISHESENQEISAQMSDYVELEDEKLFSHSRDYAWLKNGKKQGKLKLKFGKIELDNPRSISISIPPGYTEMAF